MLSSWYLDRREQSEWRRILRGSVQSLLGLVALLAAVVVMGTLIQRYLDVHALRGVIESYGILAPLVFFCICALKNVLFIPVLPLALLIGLGALMFGTVAGAFYCWLGTTAGACVAFWIGRYWLQGVAARLKRGKWQRLDEVLSGHGFLSMLGLRLVLFSNIPLNLGSGLTSITGRDYAAGTLLGLLPRTFVVAYAFDSMQDPNVWAALLIYPNSLLLTLLLLSMVGGVLLLTSLARNAMRATA
jgi:uncharacterized membrane protein YdjX (TVP38/TMEM64 family)